MSEGEETWRLFFFAFTPIFAPFGKTTDCMHYIRKVCNLRPLIVGVLGTHVLPLYRSPPIFSSLYSLHFR
jgi:hypothetical protein